MGKELVKKAASDPRINLSGVFEKKDHRYINQNLGEVLSVKTNLKILSDPDAVFSLSDVVIDFTSPSSTLNNIRYANKNKTPLVIGTTGLTKKIYSEIVKASKKTPILQSHNMSLGVNLLLDLVKQASNILDKYNYDIEISETHHKHKIDAPSGTAISLGEYAAKGRNDILDKVKVLDRNNKKRKTGEIGFSVQRAGEISGEHQVSFIGINDRIDLSHKAFNRSIFVNGAIDAAIFLTKQKPGLYTMANVIKRVNK